jgi:hypothetical protein
MSSNPFGQNIPQGFGSFNSLSLGTTTTTNQPTLAGTSIGTKDPFYDAFGESSATTATRKTSQSNFNIHNVAFMQLNNSTDAQYLIHFTSTVPGSPIKEIILTIDKSNIKNPTFWNSASGKSSDFYDKVKSRMPFQRAVFYSDGNRDPESLNLKILAHLLIVFYLNKTKPNEMKNIDPYSAFLADNSF